MSFNEGSQLDSSQVEDRRGMSTGVKVGGGIGGGLLVLVLSLLGFNPSLLDDLTGGAEQPPAQSQSAGQSGVSQCHTGAQANQQLACRITGTVNSLNDFWPDYLRQYGKQYPRPKTVLFTQRTQSGCGPATTEVGPFYCPADRTAYFDPGFFQELVTQFGSSGGPLAQEYVVAHEFGHHVQNILGTIDYAQRDPQGPQSGGVRVELQADCFAGIWAHYASTQPSASGGQPFLKPLTQTDIRDALSAASSVGDDRIQKAATGRVSPESWTHGSSAQRQKWFLAGYQSGELNKCDTFSGRV
ncbi:putative metalloprotease [Arthrobacter woluwensis]|uniref:KPN_02809 family neutral zinc metallopeptidase n=1 Tax=Arthrobacter woluwensis TaxID=156980 RepID=UPI002782DE29|nr:neutral zinc metallopeptidase [Arthrobacter woluwensis]MDQ0708922.1 putative metalloprotease [Arthrobacter woluwensis]